MKRLGAILLCGFFLVGCGTAARQSEFWQHDSMYENWDHTRFSVYGFKHPTTDTLKKSKEQGWWGIPIETNE